MVAVGHRFGEWQSNHTSSRDLVYNDRCIQDRMGCGLPRASHKWELVGRRKKTSYKRIRTQGRLSGLKSFLKNQSISRRGLSENRQHHSNSSYKQQERYEVGLPHNFNVGTLEVVPGEEHSVVDTTGSRQTKHHRRLGIEGV